MPGNGGVLIDTYCDKAHANRKFSLHIRMGRVGKLEIVNRKKYIARLLKTDY
jgi:hypothetical protein